MVQSLAALIASSASRKRPHGLNAQRVRAAFRQSRHLLLERLVEVLRRRVSTLLFDDAPGGAHSGCNVTPAGDDLFRKRHRSQV